MENFILSPIRLRINWWIPKEKELLLVKTFWFNFHLAFRNIVRQMRRSIMSIIAIAFGVTALILASGFIEWILFDFRESTIKSQLGHIQIVHPGYHNLGKADPYAFLLPDTMPDELAAIKELQKIKSIAPQLSFTGLVSFNELTLSFIGDGVNPKELIAFDNFPPISAGENLSTNDPLGIIVGEGLARNLDVGVGEQVVLLTNTASGGINAVEVTVRGLFSTVTKSYDDAALRLSIETARRLLHAKGSHIWVILLKDTAQTDIVLEKLRDILPPDKFEILPWYELSDFYNKTAILFAKQVWGIWLIIALIIILSIANTMTMSVMERIGEIGTAMALGMQRMGIMRLFLYEGFILGCLGGLLGIIFGLLSANIISSIGIPMPPPPGTTHGFTGEILITMDIVLGSLVLAISTTLIASIYPAWKASRMQIVDALRHNR